MRKGLYVLLFFGLFMLAALFLHQVRQDRTEQYLDHSKALLQATYNASLERYVLAMETFATDLTHHHTELMDLFVHGLQAQSNQEQSWLRQSMYQQMQPYFEDLKKRGIEQWQFLQADGTSFLRFHAPDYHDDSLVEVRPSLQSEACQEVPCYGFEVGRFFIGFRFIQPIRVNDSQVGYMETAVSFAPIRQKLAALSPRQASLFLLERTSAEAVLADPETLLQPAAVSPDFLLYTRSFRDAQAHDLPLDSLRPLLAREPGIQQQLKEGQPFAKAVFHLGIGYAATFIPIQTLTGDLGGYIMSIHESPLLSGLQSEFYTMLVSILLITFLLIWMILYLYQQRHAIQVQNSRLDAIGAAVGEGIYVLDPQGQTLYVNEAASQLTGFDESTLYRKNLHQLLHCHEKNLIPMQQCPIYSTSIQGKRYQGDELFKTRNGTLIPVAVTSQPMVEDGQITGVVTVFRDISERKDAELKLKRLATTDPLTGLSNRRAFLDQLQKELRLRRRLGHPSSLLMIDFDHFKQINDRYGHPAGDQVLKHFADIASNCLRETDAIGRLGGEEFAILMPGTDLDGAMQLAERLRHLLEQTPTRTTDHQIPMTLSIGVTPLHDHDTTPSELLKRVDAALYQAKHKGRNRIEMSP